MRPIGVQVSGAATVCAVAVAVSPGRARHSAITRVAIARYLCSGGVLAHSQHPWSLVLSGVAEVAAHSEPILFRTPEGMDQGRFFGSKTKVASCYLSSHALAG